MMEVDAIRDILGWCAVINYAVLVIWFAVFITAHDWMHRLHGKWFNLSVERFDTIHYAGMALFKIGILLLNLAPYLALRIAL